MLRKSFRHKFYLFCFAQMFFLKHAAADSSPNTWYLNSPQNHWEASSKVSSVDARMSMSRLMVYPQDGESKSQSVFRDALSKTQVPKDVGIGAVNFESYDRGLLSSLLKKLFPSQEVLPAFCSNFMLPQELEASELSAGEKLIRSQVSSCRRQTKDSLLGLAGIIPQSPQGVLMPTRPRYCKSQPALTLI